MRFEWLRASFMRIHPLNRLGAIILSLSTHLVRPVLKVESVDTRNVQIVMEFARFSEIVEKNENNGCWHVLL